MLTVLKFPCLRLIKNAFNRMVDEEISAGQLEEAGREQRYLQLKLDYLAKTRAWMRSHAQESAEKEINVPGEPDTLKELLDAETAEQVRRICEDAYTHVPEKASPKIVTGRRVLNWPLHPASQLPPHLSDLAEQFVKAKNDPRFPRSNRPSSRLKQLWFLSRAARRRALRRKYAHLNQSSWIDADRKRCLKNPVQLNLDAGRRRQRGGHEE